MTRRRKLTVEVGGRDRERAPVECEADTWRASARVGVVSSRTANGGAAGSVAGDLGPPRLDGRSRSDDESSARVDDHRTGVANGAADRRRTGSEPVGLGGERGVGDRAGVLGGISTTEI